MNRSLIPLLAGLVGTAGLFSCSMPPNGGATGWRKERSSGVADTRFIRASSEPVGTDVIYYDAPEAIKIMSNTATKRVGALQQTMGQMVEWGIKGHTGFLATYKRDHGWGRRFVEGKKDQEYAIVVKNRCKSTLEIVASVDGMDVVDRKTASYFKRGYLIHPGATLEIDGFRTSTDSVATFKFSSVEGYYSKIRHADTRHIGVIGIAVFTQKDVNPWTGMPSGVR